MEIVRIESRANDAAYVRWLHEQLEAGNILLLHPTPFLPSPEDAGFLRGQKQSANGSHKNIAYKPHQQRTTGVKACSPEDAGRLSRILRSYSEGSLACLGTLLPHYAAHWHVDYATFRPEEEAGRPLPLKHRNDLMHVDAFPTRPTRGARILRSFTNIHPSRERVWATADEFACLAERYAASAGLHQVTGTAAATRRLVGKVVRTVGLPVPERTAYDEFMLGFHHYLKGNAEFQETGCRQTSAFPPGSTWISFTDQVAHKVVSGQYALEQTCIIPLEAMLMPERAPAAILERLAARRLTV